MAIRRQCVCTQQVCMQLIQCNLNSAWIQHVKTFFQQKLYMSLNSEKIFIKNSNEHKTLFLTE